MNRRVNFSAVGSLSLALLVAALPFAAPQTCALALREGLALCGGPLLLSLYPFLVVSLLLIQCPMGEMLGLPFCPVARLIGVRAPCAGRVLLIGFLGGFAPAASAAAQAVRSGQLSPRQADALLPACVCSGPSFVILTVGQTLLGSTELGVLLFTAQLLAGYLSAAVLARMQGDVSDGNPEPAPHCPLQTMGLEAVLTQAGQSYVRLCGFVLFFRMLAAGAGELLPSAVATLSAMLLEVCSGCDLASRTGYWASTLCCAALSMQGLSVLMQVRALCPPELTLRPLYYARLLHLPLSLALFYVLLPGGERETFSTLYGQVMPMRRLPADCALLVFLACCMAVCALSRAMETLAADEKGTETDFL